MTRRDWLLSTFALAPAAYPAAAPSSALVTDVVVLEAGPRRVLKDDARVGKDGTDPSRVRNDDAGLLRKDQGSPRVLFERGASRTAGLPGSTLKPLVLSALLDRKLLKPDERLACPGGFHLGRHNLEC